jgi:hypothetical protein
MHPATLTAPDFEVAVPTSHGECHVSARVTRKGLVAEHKDMMFGRVLSDTVFHTLELMPTFTVDAAIVDGQDVHKYLSAADIVTIDQHLYAHLRAKHALADSTYFSIMED